jgi:hypothetical protein
MPYRTPITSFIIILRVHMWFPPDVRRGRGQVYHVLIFPTLYTLSSSSPPAATWDI